MAAALTALGRRLSATLGQLPNLLVIGAMKCGTSSLHRYLDLHPEISMSRTKELNFFLPVDSGAGAGSAARTDQSALLAERSNRGRGMAWYESQFGDAPVRGESSVAYSFPWFEGVADAIGSALGEPRLIYLVRDPIERMLSHRDQFARRDRRPTAEALLDERAPYLQASRYATALAPFLEQFGRERVLIVDQAQLRDEREPALTDILAFLGLDPSPVLRSPALAEESNVSAGKGRAFRVAEKARSSTPGAAVAGRLPRGLRSRVADSLRRDDPVEAEPLSPEQRARLLDLLEPEIAGLEALTGWDLSDWR